MFRHSNNAKEPLIIVPGTLGSWPVDYFEKMAEAARDILFKKVYPMRSLKGLVLKNVSSLIIEGWDRVEDNPELLITQTTGRIFCIDPISDAYSNFFNKLNAVGLKKDRDWFVFGYDTLMTPIDQNGERLYSFMKEVLIKTGAKKARIIAHSQGCLVTRYMLQEANINGDYGINYVSSVLLAGPPNNGVVNIYFLTEGGVYNEILAIKPESISDFKDKARDDISLDMITTYLLHMESYASDIDPKAVKKYIEEKAAPIRQMLPVFQYLYDISEGGNDEINADVLEIGFASKRNARDYAVENAVLRTDNMNPAHYPQNPFLRYLNSSDSIEKLRALGSNNALILYGAGMKSPDKIYVDKNVSGGDIWTHGIPVATSYTNETDGIVLVKSAIIEGTENYIKYMRIEDCPHSSCFTPYSPAFGKLMDFVRHTEG